MIALIQRVNHSAICQNDKPIAEISKGMLVFLAVERHDGLKHVDGLLKKLLNFRIFEDSHGHMNRSVEDIRGEVLIVSQFTLLADTSKGSRPSFHRSPDKKEASEIYGCFVERAVECYSAVKCGDFGSDYQVYIENDGPATFWLNV
jgi:D-aminoacyl-tRNA deacylase